METTIRNETPADYRKVEELVREAFWNHYVPGCSEHYLAHTLRGADAFLPELDFVALKEDTIIGNIMYAQSEIVGDDGTKHPVLTFGPFAVLPAFQNAGVGQALLSHSLAAAKALGHTAVLIFGDPAFYTKVGFVPAESYGIGTSWNSYLPSLLALELVPGALKDCAGLFYEGDAYDFDAEEARAFDRNFSAKQECSGLPSQLRFAQLVASGKPRS